VPSLDLREEFSKEELKEKFREVAARSKTHAILTRPEFAQSTGLSEVVFTNHFAIELPTEDLYEYKMEGIITTEQAEEDQVPTTARRQDLMREAINNSSVLRSASGTYATDDLEKIIAWTPLPSTDKVGGELQSIQIVIQPSRQGHAAITRELKLIYIGRVPVAKVAQASSGDIQDLPLESKGETGMSAIEAMNMIIGHSVRHPLRVGARIIRLGGNKFFSTDAQSTIDLHCGLVCLKGFFFTLRHGMGKPLLNVSSAATAFYKPNIRVSDFMKQFCGINNTNKRSFSNADLARLKNALKGVRVSVRHENRVRTITDIATLDQNPSRLTFTDAASGVISVADFLDQQRSK
jgi:eukaryotic translation initiation factor 2C